MPELQTIWLFGIASLALCVSPGPDMVLVAARSAAQGKVAGFVTSLGISAGSMFHAFLLAVGLTQLFLAVPYAYDFVRYLGAGYLLYLAWQAFAARNSFAIQSPKVRRKPLFAIFRQGCVSNILNPKVALFYLALFPQFLNPASGSLAVQILVLALVLQVIGFLVLGAVILLSGSIGDWFAKEQTFTKWSRYFLGLVFGSLAVRLIFDDAR